MSVLSIGSAGGGMPAMISLSLGEGNGTPLQYSCWENPMDWRSLVGCSPWGRKELDTTERLHFHFSLSCIGEGNGNPLQCPCLENPRDRGAWWAAVCGVAQNWTRLKRLSSSRQHIKKQRHYFINKGLSSQGYGFSSGHVWM